jgi:hypothetical protein
MEWGHLDSGGMVNFGGMERDRQLTRPVVGN